jgi:MoxR-like ATPase
MATDTSTPGFDKLMAAFRADYDKIIQQVRAVIVGHEEVVHQTLACMFAGGHALLEGVPGIGKTLLVRTIGDATELAFSRIQFTPDLMPADITGTSIVVTDERGGKSFQFQQGPLFANLVLADEINRATPKTQSALLEAMQEQTVSVARTTHRLPGPFFVLATQNPLEMEGTYPLPEAQLDRFMYKIRVGSPAAEELVSIMDLTTGLTPPKAQKVADGPRIEAMRACVRQVAAASHVKRYIARLVVATHPTPPGSPEVTRKFIRYGASPRAAQAMLLGAKVLALRDGRANVAFDDVRQTAAPALRHRLILSFEGQAEGADPDRIIEEVLESIPQEDSS